MDAIRKIEALLSEYRHASIGKAKQTAHDKIVAAFASKEAELVRLREALFGDNGALTRMDRARGWLTDGSPRPECNYGVLDTSDLRAALATTPQPTE